MEETRAWHGPTQGRRPLPGFLGVPLRPRAAAVPRALPPARAVALVDRSPGRVGARVGNARGPASVSATPGKDSGAWGRVPRAFLSLAQLSLSELRCDVARLFDSHWDEAQRHRILELSTALGEACHRQGLGELGRVARSVAGLAGLSRGEALPLSLELRKKFKELFALAELVISRGARTPA
jgi:hypothetical protein